MFAKKVPLFYLLLFTVTAVLVTYFTDNFISKSSAAVPAPALSENGPSDGSCNYNIMRLNGYKYIHPFLHAEPECESKKYQDLKNTLTDFLAHAKADGSLLSASVYLSDLSREEWMGINAEDRYHPGSLLKVATLLTYLRMAETRPEILDLKFHFDPKTKVKDQFYQSQSITPGKEYTVRELLRYMIAYSDNRAAHLLHDYIDGKMFQKTFADMGFAVPENGSKEYFISAREYSEFLKVLYDGSYLTIRASEYATSLLSECDFREGVVKGLPSTVRIAHKFGESGDNNIHELHESAIVYLDNNPYLITVMTRGRDLTKMARSISYISKLTYERMNVHS